MTTREKRFFSAHSELEHDGTVQAAPAGMTGWRFAKRTHPISGEEMALGIGLDHRPRSTRGQDRSAMTARAVVTATLVGAAVESGFGMDFHHVFRYDGRIDLPPDPQNTSNTLVHCMETAPSKRGTAQVRVGWDLDASTAAPGVVKFRGRPAVGRYDEHLIYMGLEMPTGWPAPEHPERYESVLTNRTAAYHANDKVTFGIPWVHPNGELLVTFALEEIRKAAQHVRGLVTPAPASD